jgi:hypothetical protein
MKRPLTPPQRQRLVRQLQTLLHEGPSLHVGLIGHHPPDWMKAKWVLGTPDDVTLTKSQRDCVGCGQDIYTRVHDPDDVPVACEVCLYEELIEKEPAVA